MGLPTKETSSPVNLLIQYSLHRRTINKEKKENRQRHDEKTNNITNIYANITKTLAN